MRKVLSVFSFVTMLLFVVSVMAADKVVVIPLNTSSPVYIAGTEITSLPYTITSSGLYFITKDLTLSPSTNHGILIAADNVTLDLMGFSLIGPGSSYPAGGFGINLTGRSNIEIRNGTVTNFGSKAIAENSGYQSGADCNRIINIRAIDNRSGIILNNFGNRVEKCTVKRVTSGSAIYAGYGSTVKGNVCFLNWNDGIQAGLGSTIIGNTVSDNGGYGLRLYSSFADQNTSYSNTLGSYTCSSCTLGNNYLP